MLILHTLLSFHKKMLKQLSKKEKFFKAEFDLLHDYPSTYVFISYNSETINVDRSAISPDQKSVLISNFVEPIRNIRI